MNGDFFLNRRYKPIRCAVALSCLSLTQVAVAASAPRQVQVESAAAPARALNLDLPDNAGLNAGQGGIVRRQSANAAADDQDLQLLAGNHKKARKLNMDCGVDLLQPSNQDASLTGRLSGECDIKYPY